VKQQDTTVKRAVELSVKIALGTDAAVYPHGSNAVEFQLMAADGLTPVQSLQAGTIAAADLLGLKDSVAALRGGGYLRGGPAIRSPISKPLRVCSS
jgi:imidazolonepropionase-like amidohydrolase